MGINMVKLYQELLAAELPVLGVQRVGERQPDGLAVDVQIDWAMTPNADQLAAAEAIKAAHDPVDYAGQETAEGRAALRAQAVEVLADFQLALDNWATLTTAQQKAVLKRVVQVEVALIKLMRHLV